MACAYCNGGEKLTREHIWPRCILKRTPSYKVKYAAKAKKIVGSDLTINDVCHLCNNGPLSVLDNYLCELYDEYFTREVPEGTPVFFKYDFDLLSRALLKITYNSARTTDSDLDILKNYAPVIISEDTSPVGIHIKLATIYSSYTQNQQGVTKEIKALGVRSGPFMITNRSRKGVAARTIQINSFRFYLMATDNIDDRALAVKYLANQTGTWLRRNGEVLVPAPSLSALDAMEGIQHWRKP